MKIFHFSINNLTVCPVLQSQFRCIIETRLRKEGIFYDTDVSIDKVWDFTSSMESQFDLKSLPKNHYKQGKDNKSRFFSFGCSCLYYNTWHGFFCVPRYCF